MADVRQSETIGELAKALAAAQGEIRPPKKDKVGKVKGTNRHGQSYEYEYRYSDLAALFDAVREPFAKHGLSYMQPLRFDDGHVILETVLLHQSGEWRRSEYPIPAELILKPQEFGSALTYGRRYSASGLFGIASEEDDDGKAAQAAEPAGPAPGMLSRSDAAALVSAAKEAWPQLDAASVTTTLLQLASTVADREIERLSQFPAARTKDLYAAINQWGGEGAQ